MAVYYKFKSAKDYNSIPIDGHFISVGNLKEKIFESKQLGRGTDFDLVVSNAQTSEEYLDESMLIPKNTSVLIRRVPGRPRMPIVTAPIPEPDETRVENGYDDVQSVRNGSVSIDSSAVKYPDDLEWDEFGNDLYAIPEMAPPQSSNTVQDAPPPSKVDEDSKIKALIETPSLDWQQQSADIYGTGRGFGRGMGGRMMGGRGFGRGGLERKTPPGYVCHRCKIPGHFIQHCPTNGDPNFDIRRVKPPTGIPKSMLMATPDGSYVLPGGAAAVLKPNEAAFEKEIEGMPTNRPVGDLPPELHCPLCKEVIKDAVLTSKCCFNSFCDRCIRDYIISRSMCVCGATNILADDLLPNKTLRDAISRILESNNSSGNDGGSNFQPQDMESRNPHAKPLSPAQSVASKDEQGVEAAGQNIEPAERQEGTQRVNDQHQTSEQGRPSRVVDVSEATAESLSVKEPKLQGNAPLLGEEVQQKPSSGEAAKKKKKKKARLPMNGTEMPWRNPQDLAAESYMMPMPPAAYNPYWNGMQPGMEGFGPGMQPGMEGFGPVMRPGMEGFVGPYAGNVPYMGFGLGPGPLDMPFGAVLPHEPFGGPGCMFPPFVPPQRDLAAEFGMGYNPGPPLMSREEFEAKKADLKRKREFERRGEREIPKDRGYGREVNSMGDVPSMKSRPNHGPSSSENLHQRQRAERPSPDLRSRDSELAPPSSKRKSEQHQPHYHHHRDRDDRDTHKRHAGDDYYPEDHHPRHREYVGDKKPSHDQEGEYVEDKKSSYDREYVNDKKPSHHRSGGHQHHSKATPEPPAAVPKSSSTSDKKQKGSVFSRISFPAEGQLADSKKRKVSSSGEVLAPAPSVSGSHSHRGQSNGYYDDHKTTSMSRKSSAPVDVDYDQSSEEDDDRHFKRKPSRYESSPAAAMEWEEEGPPAPRHSSRGTREREREKEHGGGSYSKQR